MEFVPFVFIDHVVDIAFKSVIKCRLPKLLTHWGKAAEERYEQCYGNQRTRLLLFLDPADCSYSLKEEVRYRLPREVAGIDLASLDFKRYRLRRLTICRDKPIKKFDAAHTAKLLPIVVAMLHRNPNILHELYIEAHMKNENEWNTIETILDAIVAVENLYLNRDLLRFIPIIKKTTVLFSSGPMWHLPIELESMVLESIKTRRLYSLEVLTPEHRREFIEQLLLVLAEKAYVVAFLQISNSYKTFIESRPLIFTKERYIVQYTYNRRLIWYNDRAQ